VASNTDLTPVDEYLLNPEKPLWWELSKRISGLGNTSALHFLKQFLPFEKDRWGTICYNDLSTDNKNLLEAMLRKKELNIDNVAVSNRKRKTSLVEEEGIVKTVNPIVWGNALHATMKMDIVELKKERCRIGERHQVGLSVHGQRNRTTGKCSSRNGAKVVKSVKSAKKPSTKKR
jgi:ribosomal protein S13